MQDTQDPREDLPDWLRLALTPGVGPAAVRDLMTAFGLPEDILSAGRLALDRVVGPALAAALLARDDARERAVDAHLEWALRPGNRLVTLIDADYPPALLQIGDPPPLLCVTGDASRLRAPSIAVVGSRSATRGGLETAEAFARALGDAGLAVVSGLAVGIDAAAHRGALRTASGTVAVTGTGADVVYPPENRALADEIVAAGGALVTEMPLGTGPRRANFPRRNRLIAGLSLGVLVVEAALRSGSLITARLAGEFGREVFAIPGSIHSTLAKGCHRLIKQGAKLVESAQDVLAELAVPLARPAVERGPAAPPADDADEPLLRAIGWDPVDVERIARRVGADEARAGAAVAARLSVLELEGRVERLADGRYQRRGAP